MINPLRGFVLGGQNEKSMQSRMVVYSLAYFVHVVVSTIFIILDPAAFIIFSGLYLIMTFELIYQALREYTKLKVQQE